MTKILIFGITGSIGQQALKIIRNNTKFKVVGFSYYRHEKHAQQLKKELHIVDAFHSSTITTYEQIEGYIKNVNPDMIINAISGIAGLNYTLASINQQKDLLLANKESLVMCGKWLVPKAMRTPGKLLPIDSEHSALLLLLKNRDKNKEIKNCYITASGGRYFNASIDELKEIKYTDAINHPNWNMGQKISVDSATLINKAFEVIEAYWLFQNLRVQVLLEPTSHVHAIIEYTDKSIDAFISEPSMLEPIHYALNKYENVGNEKIQHFSSLKDLPYPTQNMKGTKLLGMKYVDEIFNNFNSPIAPIICIADEYAIELFKKNKIGFLDIYRIIDQCINKYKNQKIESYDDIKKLMELIKIFIGGK